MRRILNLILSLIVILMAIPTLSYAVRPLSTDDTATVEVRHIEIESGFEYVKKTDEENNLSFVLKYGVIKNLDLGIEFPYKFIDFREGSDVDGIGDIKITTKYRFLDERGALPSLALSFSIKTETGNDEKTLSSCEEDYVLNGIMTKKIGKFVTHSNFGYTFVGEPGEDSFSYGSAIEYHINKGLNILFEITGETIFDGDFDDNPCSGLIGLNYALNEIMVSDFGIGFELSDASPDYRVITGLTLGF